MEKQNIIERVDEHAKNVLKAMRVVKALEKKSLFLKNLYQDHLSTIEFVGIFESVNTNYESDNQLVSEICHQLHNMFKQDIENETASLDSLLLIQK